MERSFYSGMDLFTISRRLKKQYKLKGWSWDAGYDIELIGNSITRLVVTQRPSDRSGSATSSEVL